MAQIGKFTAASVNSVTAAAATVGVRRDGGGNSAILNR